MQKHIFIPLFLTRVSLKKGGKALQLSLTYKPNIRQKSRFMCFFMKQRFKKG